MRSLISFSLPLMKFCFFSSATEIRAVL
jgi:hypothetical protein